MVKDTILRWCQELTQFYKVNESSLSVYLDDESIHVLFIDERV